MIKILKLTTKELINIFENKFEVRANFSMTENNIDVIEFSVNNSNLNELMDNLCEAFYIDNSLIEVEKDTETTSILKVDIIDTMAFLEAKFDTTLSFDYSLNNSDEIEFKIL